MNDIISPLIIAFLEPYIEINLDTLDLPKDLNNLTDPILMEVQANVY